MKTMISGAFADMKVNATVLIVVIVFSVVALVFPRAAASQVIWGVEVVETRADTITVRVSVPQGLRCGFQECSFAEFYDLYVTPCPLNKACSGDTYGELLMYQGQTVTLLFRAGNSYTLYGSYQTYGYYTDGKDPCNQPCYRSGNIGPSAFPEDYVSTSGATWGYIKALFSAQ